MIDLELDSVIDWLQAQELLEQPQDLFMSAPAPRPKLFVSGVRGAYLCKLHDLAAGERIHRNHGLMEEALHPFIARPLSVFYQGRQCSMLVYPYVQYQPVDARSFKDDQLRKELADFLIALNLQQNQHQGGNQAFSIGAADLSAQAARLGINQALWQDHINKSEILLKSYPPAKQHCDFTITNLGARKKPHKKLLVLDWDEYGASGYPLLDLATLLHSYINQTRKEFGFDPDAIGALLDQLVDPLVFERVMDKKDFVALLPFYTLAFLVIKERFGFGARIRARYQSAMANMEPMLGAG